MDNVQRVSNCINPTGTYIYCNNSTSKGIRRTELWLSHETDTNCVRLRFSQRWLWRVSSSGMWRRVVCWVATDPCWDYFLRPWRWSRCVPPKGRLQLNRLHGVTSQRMILFRYKLGDYEPEDSLPVVREGSECFYISLFIHHALLVFVICNRFHNIKLLWNNLALPRSDVSRSAKWRKNTNIHESSPS
jgi:hypothetical protein